MNNLIQLLAALMGSLGFAALYNLHGKKLAFASLGGLFAWAVYLLTERFTPSPYVCAFVSSVALTLYAEFFARRHKTPVTVYLVTSTIPLIPGAGLYRAASALLHRQQDVFTAQGIHTLLFAACMSAGITLTTMIFRVVLSAVRHRKN